MRPFEEYVCIKVVIHEWQWEVNPQVRLNQMACDFEIEQLAAAIAIDCRTGWWVNGSVVGTHED